jgi:hypothetical protein
MFRPAMQELSKFEYFQHQKFNKSQNLKFRELWVHSSYSWKALNEYRFTTHWFHNFCTSCFSAFLMVVGLKLYQQTYNLSIGS